MEFLYYAGAIIAGYLIGSVPTGFLVAKLKGIDIREHGSGNIGTTNVWRTAGRVPGLLTFLGDSAKGFLAVYAGLSIGPPAVAVICGLTAIAGHSWPVFLQFKGGKIIATGLGVLCGLSFKVALMAVLVWLVTVGISRYISLGSILAAVSVPVWMYLLDKNYAFLTFGVLAAVFAVYRHRDNISRLISGSEFKIGQKER